AAYVRTCDNKGLMCGPGGLGRRQLRAVPEQRRRRVDPSVGREDLRETLLATEQTNGSAQVPMRNQRRDVVPVSPQALIDLLAELGVKAGVDVEAERRQQNRHHDRE